MSRGEAGGRVELMSEAIVEDNKAVTLGEITANCSSARSHEGHPLLVTRPPSADRFGGPSACRLPSSERKNTKAAIKGGIQKNGRTPSGHN